MIISSKITTNILGSWKSQITESFRLEGILRSSILSPCYSKVTYHILSSTVSSQIFCVTKDGDDLSEKGFPCVYTKFTIFWFVLIAVCSVHTTEKKFSSVFFILSCQIVIRCSLRLFHRLNTCSSLHTWQILQSFHHRCDPEVDMLCEVCVLLEVQSPH